VWGNRVSPRPCPREGLALTQGYRETGFPHTHPPAGGFGRENPSYADRLLPHPPPLGAGTGRLPPAGGGWEGGNLVSLSPCGCGPEARAPRPPPAGGFGRENPSYADRPLPHPPPLGAGTGRLPPAGGGWEGGNRVSASPCGCGPEARALRPPPAGGCGRAQPARREMGKPGVPIHSPGGRVWKGRALPETTYVHPVGVRRSRHWRHSLFYYTRNYIKVTGVPVAPRWGRCRRFAWPPRAEKRSMRGGYASPRPSTADILLT